MAGTVTRAPWPEGDQQAQIDYLKRHQDALFTFFDDQIRRTEERSLTIEQRLTAVGDEARQESATTRTAVLGGPTGEGLRGAVVGLAVTAVGLAFTLIAAIGA
jgi:hypothetical protein